MSYFYYFKTLICCYGKRVLMFFCILFNCCFTDFIVSTSLCQVYNNKHFRKDWISIMQQTDHDLELKENTPH